MSQNGQVAEEHNVSMSPQYPGSNDDLEMQDIKCDVCGKVFTRLDHLRRHERAHSAEKPFACVECKRRFSRLDVLRRHQSSHDMSRKGNTPDGVRRYSRACFACASARVKCLGGTVCHRCRRRDLPCEYPTTRDHSRLVSRKSGQSDRMMIEREDNDFGVTASFDENGLHSEVLESVPKDHMWANQFVEVMDSNSSPVAQSQAASRSEVASAATDATRKLPPEKSAMSTEDQLLPENFIEQDQTIIAGACLIPRVSEGNIGSIYNYSIINWLAPNEVSQTNWSSRAPLLQSTERLSVNAQSAFPNETQKQNMQSRLRQVNLISDPNKPSSPARNPSAVIGETRFEVPMYYVDGDGVRLSIPARQKQQNRSSITLFDGQSNNSLSPNSYDNLNLIDTYSSSGYAQAQTWVSEESYVALTNYLKRTSWREVSVSNIDTLPSLEELNLFARLYFDKFHESFPLLHKGSFSKNRDGCLLELAISAIGACYMKTLYARKCSEFLHELVHELLKLSTISGDNQDRFPGVFGLQRSGSPQRPTRLQALILNVLGMFHSGNPRLARLAREDRAILVTTCIESKILTTNHYDHLQGSHGAEEGDRILEQWLEGELRCRAGYFVWMLDCMMAYESDFRPHMDLSDGKAPLPCPEQIWDEPVPPKAQLLILKNGPPSLCFALNVLYTEKILVPNLGELGRILLIHGMYRRVWEVARYHSDSLSDWIPTALSEAHHRITSERTTRPSSNPLVSRWINGSCDCLDVLHWSAHTTILQASGLEHPTVLHLHLSRVILLAPVSDLQEFAKAKIYEETQSHSDSYLHPSMQGQGCPKFLLEWAVHDQSKARLAIIHAGSVFWYLRRYSCGGVIEPFANYLATLVIWAYNMSTLAVEMLAKSQPNNATYESHGVDNVGIPRTSDALCQNQDRIMQLQQTTLEGNGNSEYCNPLSPYKQTTGGLEQLGSHGTSLIQLDRPCDDELVQLFVRFGDQMTPYMARIGDIKSKDSTRKILQEGINLLSDSDGHATDSRRGKSEESLNVTWGAAENFISRLSALATTS